MKFLLVGLFVLALFAPNPSQAAIYSVNWYTTDSPDANLADPNCDITASANRCTLRAAIEQANANPGRDTIVFTGSPTNASHAYIISVTSALPNISDELVIDGRTATGYNNVSTIADAIPRIYIDGSDIGSTPGMSISGDDASGSEIHAMGIINFSHAGIRVAVTSFVYLSANWIGIKSDGSAAGNTGVGISLSLVESCVIGAHFAGPTKDKPGNLISNNGGDGIYIGHDSFRNKIGGNFIGVGPTGAGDFGNAGHGINISGSDNQIGGFREDSKGLHFLPNIISWNGEDGVNVDTGRQTISGNTISNNAGDGVELVSGTAANNNLVQYNTIYANQLEGVLVVGGSFQEIAHNEIYQNNGNAIRSNARGSKIHDNLIGFKGGVGGELAGHAFNGIVLDSDASIVSNNRIAVMADDGIDVLSGDGNQIVNNQIGMSTSGDDWGNATAGIRVRPDASNTAINANYIGFNFNGIELELDGSKVCGNHVGVGMSGEPAGNLGEGIFVKGNDNLIGDISVNCAANTIGNNGSDGIEIWGGSNIVRNNQIGGSHGADFGNGRGGVLLYTTNAVSNEIIGNQIFHNNNQGVRVYGNTGNGNRIERNAYKGNGGINIDLGDDGVTPNDSGDPDSGPNNLQNTPIITAVVEGSGALQVTYRIDSLTTASSYPLDTDFYIDGEDTANIKSFQQTDSYIQAPNSEKTITVALPVGVATGTLAAMTTDAFGNSSEFSFSLSFEVEPAGDDIFDDSFEAIP